MPHQGIEVRVGVEERKAPRDAVRADHDVARLPHRHPSAPERAVVLSAPDGQRRAEHSDDRKRLHQPTGPAEVLVAAKTLQHFRQDRIPAYDGALAEPVMQCVRLPCRPPVEVVDPDGGIDDDHDRASVRIASRSPSHLSLPRQLRMPAWRLRRTNTRKPSSTTPFFVLIPVARCASAMSRSSMTMFVRMDLSRAHEDAPLYTSARRPSTLDLYGASPGRIHSCRKGGPGLRFYGRVWVVAKINGSP